MRPKKSRFTGKKFTSASRRRKRPASCVNRAKRPDRTKDRTAKGAPFFTYRAAAGILAARRNGEMAELVEGAPLLREYRVKSSIEGSNPSLSATLRFFPRA